MIKQANAVSKIKAAEDLLKLSRELKELWLFGPLRELGEGEMNMQMDEDVEGVDKLARSVLDSVNKVGGRLEVKGET